MELYIWTTAGKVKILHKDMHEQIGETLLIAMSIITIIINTFTIIY